MTNPTHFRPGGGFRNPWPGNGSPERGLGALLADLLREVSLFADRADISARSDASATAS